MPEISADLNARFFTGLPAQTDFRAITEAAGFVAVPPRWSVAVADIMNSTEAIARGRYKDVNAVGAMCIVALLNAAPPDVELPFVFGGDGAIVLIPDTLLLRAEGVLMATRRIAREDFDLDLRVGIVPIADIYRAGAKVSVAKWDVSPFYAQALFTGGGLTLAEQWLKEGQGKTRYELAHTSSDYAPDYRGYSCRWAAIPSPKAETVSLLVQPLDDDETAQRAVYRAVLDEIARVYGTRSDYHPVAPAKMRPAVKMADLMTEAKVFARPPERAAYLRRMRLEIAVTNLWIALRTRMPGIKLRKWFHRIAPNAPLMEWGNYKNYIREASDCQKVDGTLRMILSGTREQRAQFTAFLEEGVQQHRHVYGLHAAHGALMTCLVFQPNGRQVHFVDGAEGGYALAARDLKARRTTMPPA